MLELRRIAQLISLNMETEDYWKYNDENREPRIGREFAEAARFVLTSGLHNELLNVKNFQYTNPGLSCPQWRVDMLNNIKN